MHVCSCMYVHKIRDEKKSVWHCNVIINTSILPVKNDEFSLSGLAFLFRISLIFMHPVKSVTDSHTMHVCAHWKRHCYTLRLHYDVSIVTTCNVTPDKLVAPECWPWVTSDHWIDKHVSSTCKLCLWWTVSGSKDSDKKIGGFNVVPRSTLTPNGNTC